MSLRDSEFIETLLAFKATSYLDETRKLPVDKVFFIQKPFLS